MKKFQVNKFYVINSNWLVKYLGKYKDGRDKFLDMHSGKNTKIPSYLIDNSKRLYHNDTILNLRNMEDKCIKEIQKINHALLMIRSEKNELGYHNG